MTGHVHCRITNTLKRTSFLRFYSVLIRCIVFFFFFAAVALVDTLFIDERQVTDGTGKVVAAVFEVSTPEELQMLKIENEQTENIVLGLLDWKVT